MGKEFRSIKWIFKKRLKRVHTCESRNPPKKFRKRLQKGAEKYEPFWFW